MQVSTSYDTKNSNIVTNPKIALAEPHESIILNPISLK